MGPNGPLGKLPGFSFDDDTQALGNINGRPAYCGVFEDQDLQEYLEEATIKENLLYSRFEPEIVDGRLVNDLKRNVVNIPQILNGNFGELMKEKTTAAQTEPRALEFESRFESGNLACAVSVGPNEVDLVL